MELRTTTKRGPAFHHNRKARVLDALAVFLLLLLSGFIGICVYVLMVPR